MSGLKSIIKVKETLCFDESTKRMIVEDYLQSGLTKRAIWKKYTGQAKEHGKILEWIHQYGYSSMSKGKNSSFALSTPPINMDKERSEFETLQLEKRISDLEAQLRVSEMKAIAWQTMEKEFNISIKKKFNTKSSKT